MVTEELEMHNGQQYRVTYNRCGEEIAAKLCACEAVEDTCDCWFVC